MRNTKMWERGFTLIELLVVIAIIGIISVIAMTWYSSVRANARDAKRTSNIRQIRTALQVYYEYHGFFPYNLSQLGSDAPILVENDDTLNDPIDGTKYPYSAFVDAAWTSADDVASACDAGDNSCDGFVLGANFETGNATVVGSMNMTSALVNENSAVRSLGTASTAASCDGVTDPAPTRFCYAWKNL